MRCFVERLVDCKAVSRMVLDEMYTLTAEELQEAVRECCYMMDEACTDPDVSHDVMRDLRATYDALTWMIFTGIGGKRFFSLPGCWLYSNHRYGETTYRRPRVYLWGYTPVSRLKKLLGKWLDKDNNSMI